MMMYRRARSKARFARTGHGYSLIELLVVMAIVAALITMAVPMTMQVQESSNLTRAGQMMADMLAVARQEAVSRSREVQVIFLQTPDKLQWRGMQAMAMEEGKDGPTLVPVTRVTWLPSGIAIADGGTSPLLTADPQIAGNMLIPGTGTMKYAGFRFRSNGSTGNGLTAANNYLTLRTANSVTAKNYYTLQINPVTGKVITYRP